VVPPDLHPLRPDSIVARDYARFHVASSAREACPLAYALQYAIPDLPTNADHVKGDIACFM
jgi:hypothetical protein